MQPLEVRPEVRDALARGAAVVALESALVTHGMPHPHNLTIAREAEHIVRDGGAVPATIAVIGGRIRIGLDDAGLEHLASAPRLRKISSADLAYAVASQQDGGTTVAATMICAHLAGIRVFATGGIGGVHRGAMDVSADLTELGRTPVTVVCAGAKAILDLPRTLEALETLGIPVVCYRSDEFPAFWSRSSGLAAPIRVDDVAAIAHLVRAQRELGPGGGTLVANPIPADDEIPASELAAHVEAAIADAEREGITAKAVTPYLLDRVVARTGGRSLAANVALIKNNARLAAQIANAL